MNLNNLKEEFGNLKDFVDHLEDDKLVDNETDLNELVNKLGCLMIKINNMTKKRGITESGLFQNQNAPFKHYRRENAYYELLNYEEAVRELKRVIDESTDCHVIASAFNGLGHIYAIREHYEEALYNFLKVIEFYPDYVDGYFNLAMTYINLEMYREASNELLKAIHLDPADRDSLYYLSYAYNKMGNLELSKLYFQKYKEQLGDEFFKFIS